MHTRTHARTHARTHYIEPASAHVSIFHRRISAAQGGEPRPNETGCGESYVVASPPQRDAAAAVQDGKRDVATMSGMASNASIENGVTRSGSPCSSPVGQRTVSASPKETSSI
eukprot:6207628-Pleurochrysis_carterae.AAC.4